MEELRIVIGWLVVAIAAVSVNPADAGGPRDSCNDKKLGSWVDFTIEIPGENAPDNLLAVMASCQRTKMAEAVFGFCDADLVNVVNVPTGLNSYTFRSKSGKQHGLLCPHDAEPKIVPPFASEVCKLQDAATDCETRSLPRRRVRVAFKCNAAKTEISFCKGDGQKDRMKPDGTEVFFGGKGKLNSIKCSPDEPPYITHNYARDVCSLADPKDTIGVEGGLLPVNVYFECNEAKDAILKCFPHKRKQANAIESYPPGRGVVFDEARIGRDYKRIFCSSVLKPEIIKETGLKSPDPYVYHPQSEM